MSEFILKMWDEETIKFSRNPKYWRRSVCQGERHTKNTGLNWVIDR